MYPCARSVRRSAANEPMSARQGCLKTGFGPEVPAHSSIMGTPKLRDRNMKLYLKLLMKHSAAIRSILFIHYFHGFHVALAT